MDKKMNFDNNDSPEPLRAVSEPKKDAESRLIQTLSPILRSAPNHLGYSVDFEMQQFSPKASKFYLPLSPVPAITLTTPNEKLSPAACSTIRDSRDDDGSYQLLDISTPENSKSVELNVTYDIKNTPRTSKRSTNSYERNSVMESTASTSSSQSFRACKWREVGRVVRVETASGCTLWSMTDEPTDLNKNGEDKVYIASRIIFESDEESSISDDKVAACRVTVKPECQEETSSVQLSPRLQKKSPLLTEKNCNATFEKSPKPQLNTPMKQRANTRSPIVKPSKLCLSNHNQVTMTKSPNKLLESFVNLKNPDESFPTIDPIDAAKNGEPFLNDDVIYDKQWVDHMELDFTKWLNTLLTPPEELNVDIETNTVDIGKVWQASKMMENLTLAKTREAVSAKYHINTRLDTLRKAAFAMWNREDVKLPLARVVASIKRGGLVVRYDRDLHRDIGLQKEILELFLSYNPLWLRIGLEVVYGEIIPLQSNNDLAGLTQFLRARFFSDPNLVQTYSLANVTNLKHPVFQEHLNKFILQKFLMIVYFLDYAKRNKLIGHDPCLFRKKANYNESRAVILTFSRHVLSGVGDLTKVLRSHGYVVSHKQTYLDEYNYAVKDISSDLGDGVRLCRVVELITGDKTLTCRCRVPAISRLQKVHNIELALTAINKAGYKIADNIDAKSIADGHRMKILSLLWQIIYKFQAPRFEKARLKLQQWWRAIALRKRATEDYQRLKLSTVIIQRRWSAQMSMKNQRKLYLQQIEATKRIQTWWRCVKMVREYRVKRNSAIIIQKWWRNLKYSEKCHANYLVYRRAAIIIQKRWRARITARSQRIDYVKLRRATITIQSYWRMSTARRVYLINLKQHKAAIVLQSRWRARIACLRTREDFLRQKSAALVIQRRYRAYKLAKATSKQYSSLRMASIVIQKNWKMFKAVHEYKKLKKAAVVLQIHWRARQSSLQARNSFLLQRNAAIKIQRYYRSRLGARVRRNNYMNIKKSVVLIQRTWRATQLMHETRRRYLTFHATVIKVQSIWKMIITRKQFLRKRNAVLTLQRAWRNIKTIQNTRNEFLNMKKSAIFIQRRWRNIRESKKIRKEFVKLRQTVIFVQTQWRLKRQLREEKLKLAEKKKSINAATLIQATWRGHNVRKRQSGEIKALRERSKRAAEAATSSTTVEYRLHEAMSVLNNFVNIGQLSMCLACIDTITRLSPKGCIYFCELDLVKKIYFILENSNRSLPWMEVCLRATNILITLAKLPQTAHCVRHIDGTETIARLMSATMKADVNLFLHLSTLLWLLLNGNDEFLVEVKNKVRTMWLLKTTFSPLMRKEVKINKNESMLQTAVLPNPKPDWGLRTRKPRYFTSVYIAVHTLVELLNISTG